MKKSLKIVLTIGILAAAVLLLNPNAKHNVVRYIKNNDEQLTQLAEQMLGNDVSVTTEHNGWQLGYFASADTPIVQFTVKSGGIVPASSYKGFYYSPDNNPIGYQGVTTEFVQNGERWEYQYEGDNTGFTEKIIDNWYWFEMKF